MLFTPAQIKPNRLNRDETFLLYFAQGGCALCLRAYLGARLLLQSYQYLNLSEGANRVGGKLHGDKECPFSGVTKSGRVWRKVPESDARSVQHHNTRVRYGEATLDKAGEEADGIRRRNLKTKQKELVFGHL